jgi:hypothetical protein
LPLDLADMEDAMSGASRDYFAWCELQDKREREEQYERNAKQNTEKGQPSPVNDGILKGNENGTDRN